MTEMQMVREELKALRSLPVAIARMRLFTLMRDAANAHDRLRRVAAIVDDIDARCGLITIAEARRITAILGALTIEAAE